MDWIEEAIKREATPRQLRQETVEQFCLRFSLPISNYYYHVSKLDNKKRILEITLTKAKDRAPEILERLADEAEKGDMKAMSIYVDSILQLSKILDVQSMGKQIFIPSEIANKNDIVLNPSAIENSKE